MSLDEAARQLELAAHDTQVAFDCIGLGEIERAHTHTITARAAADAAEVALRIALTELSPEEAESAGEKAMQRIEKEEGTRY
jgi:predicted kinase